MLFHSDLGTEIIEKLFVNQPAFKATSPISNGTIVLAFLPKAPVYCRFLRSVEGVESEADIELVGESSVSTRVNLPPYRY